MMVWSAGDEPHTFIKQLNCPHDDKGRILIDDKLQVPDCPGVYAIGEVAMLSTATNSPYLIPRKLTNKPIILQPRSSMKTEWK